LGAVLAARSTVWQLRVVATQTEREAAAGPARRRKMAQGGKARMRWSG